MDQANLVLRRAQTLYLALPQAGFSVSTFEELGRSAARGIPFGALSTELKVTLIQLARAYHATLTTLGLDTPAPVAVTAAPPREDDRPIPPLDPKAVADQVAQVDADETGDVDDALDGNDDDDANGDGAGEEESLEVKAVTRTVKEAEPQEPSPPSAA